MRYTIKRYERLLELMLKNGYRFGSFQEQKAPYHRTVYLRHDVDLSIEGALTFAKINAQYGIKATFFFMLRSRLYNFLSPPFKEGVESIFKLGHTVGIHVILPEGIRGTNKELRTIIERDFQIMQEEIPRMQPIFSWHNPSIVPGLIERGWSFEVPGFANVYSRRFMKEMPYFSDSNFRHSVHDLERIINTQHSQFQLLLHPYMWVASAGDEISVMANNWKLLIREREFDFLLNAKYRKKFPRGLPKKVLDNFVKGVIK